MPGTNAGITAAINGVDTSSSRDAFGGPFGG